MIIKNNFATVSITSKGSVSLRPKNQYLGTVLDEERLNQLYTTYTSLLVEQYVDDTKFNKKK